MRTWILIAPAATLATVWGGPALGQNFPLGNPAMLLQQSGVQKELKMTEEQVRMAKEISEKILRQFRDEGQRRKSDPDWPKKRQEMMQKEVMPALMKEVNAILIPEQLKRLRQIANQENGPLAFSDPQVANTLNLTTEQTERIKGINQEYHKRLFAEVMKMGAGGSPQPDLPLLRKIRKESVAKITSLLSNEQTKLYLELVGERFEVKKDRQKDREEKGLSPKIAERRVLTPRPGRGDVSWVEKQLAEVEESRTERKIDEIGWAKDVREAVRLAKEHNRPIYVFTYDGDFRRGRC